VRMAVAPTANCNAGYYCPGGQSAANPVGYECGPGFYCIAGSSAKSPCPAGYACLTPPHTPQSHLRSFLFLFFFLGHSRSLTCPFSHILALSQLFITHSVTHF
jgi:hypothetical protein